MKARIRVLYAEDNTLDSDLTAEHFAREAPDIDVDVVNSGQRCLDRSRAAATMCCCWTTTCRTWTGPSILLEMAARQIAIPVVMVTGVGDEALVVQVLRLGACDYVTKEGPYLATLPAVISERGHRATARRATSALPAGFARDRSCMSNPTQRTSS